MFELASWVIKFTLKGMTYWLTKYMNMAQRKQLYTCCLRKWLYAPLIIVCAVLNCLCILSAM